MLHTEVLGNWSTSAGEENILIYEHGIHLGHVTCIMLNDLHFIVPKSVQKWLKMDQWCLEKEKKYFLHVNDFGPRARNDNEH